MVYILTGGSTCLVVVPMYMCSSKQWPLTCSYKKFNVLYHNIFLKTNSRSGREHMLPGSKTELSLLLNDLLFKRRKFENDNQDMCTCSLKLRVLFGLFLWRIPWSLAFCLDYFYDRDKQPLSVTYTDWTD